MIKLSTFILIDAFIRASYVHYIFHDIPHNETEVAYQHTIHITRNPYDDLQLAFTKLFTKTAVPSLCKQLP